MRSRSRSLCIAALAAAGVGYALPGFAQGSGCLAHRPKYIEDSFEVRYAAGCSGHDEPELFPVSTLAGSAQNLTWTIVLPTDATRLVSDTGPTFWFGGPVTDPHSLFGQAFVELQFYPDGIVNGCQPDGGYTLAYQANAYTACSPVWKVTTTGQKGVFHETAAFNAMLADSASPKKPLVMSAGDTVTVHWFSTPAKDGWHVTVTDVTTGHSGTIVLNSPQDGPLNPVFDVQQVGNSLGWGIVNDAPASFVWEIGHESAFASPPSAFCVPGQVGCDSYDAGAWAGTLPIQIKSVTFADGSAAKKWGVVSDYGGVAEVNQSCASYGGSFCIYPWYTLGASGFHFGVDFSDTLKDYGQAFQFAQTPECGGPFGANSTYCSTILK
jgi:hypothetical protein